MKKWICILWYLFPLAQTHIQPLETDKEQMY